MSKTTRIDWMENEAFLAACIRHSAGDGTYVEIAEIVAQIALSRTLSQLGRKWVKTVWHEGPPKQVVPGMVLIIRNQAVLVGYINPYGTVEDLGPPHRLTGFPDDIDRYAFVTELSDSDMVELLNNYDWIQS